MAAGYAFIALASAFLGATLASLIGSAIWPATLASGFMIPIIMGIVRVQSSLTDANSRQR